VTRNIKRLPPPVEFDSDQIQAWAITVFSAVGMSEDKARVVVENLMFAEHRGVTSHGLSRIPVYVSRIRRGGINSRPRITEHTLGAVSVVDGDAGAGAPVALHGAGLAAAGARSHGIGLATVRNIAHAGALGFYATWLTDQGLAAIVASNADPIMVPPGGGRPVLGSNPLALAVPTPRDRHTTPILDMATTAAAHGKVVMAAARGETIPPGWAVDSDGRETTDPHAALSGALLPAAGAKGFGLSFMIDVLAAGLAGGRIGREITPLYSDLDLPQGVCLFIIAIDPAHCAGSDSLGDATNRVVTAVKQSRLGTSVMGEPMVPGEPEQRHRATNGSVVRLPKTVVEQLREACDGLAGPLPSPIDE
jgi:LDH2 family malate/lactate/ureidoglycolate dehydrogenase